jgi:hypothetical protein
MELELINLRLQFRQDIPGAAQLPAVKWKLVNIRRMTKAKHAAAVKNLERVLFEQTDPNAEFRDSKIRMLYAE